MSADSGTLQCLPQCVCASWRAVIYMEGPQLSQAIEFQISRGLCGTPTEAHALSVYRDLCNVLLYAFAGRVPAYMTEPLASGPTKLITTSTNIPEAIEENARQSALSTKTIVSPD